VPIILGDNIGTCITAGLASLGANRNAKRAAFAHVMFNVIGTTVILCVLPYYIWIVSKTADSLPRQAANAHTIFNVLNALVFLPFVPLYAKAIERIIPGPSMDKREAVHLDERLLSTPAIALEQAIRELARMTAFVAVSLRSVEKAMRTGNLRWIDDVNEDEEAVDELHHQITDYLVAISERALAADISEKIPSVLHCVDDVERIGDMAVRLKDILEEKISSKAVFSESATTDLGNLQGVAVHTLEETQRALAYRDISIARGVLAEKANMEDLVRQIHENHINRLCDGQCQVRAGVFFLEMIKRYENIGTRCRDICEAVVKHLGEDS
jgi:phosphate:Na+ symporter